MPTWSDNTVQNNGFGLNYNEGFGSKSGGTFSTYNQSLEDALKFNRSNQQYDKQLAGQEALTKMQTDAATEQAKISAQAATAGTRAQQSRFNQVFPWLQGQYNALGGGAYTAGGQSPASPEISVGGVLNPQQVQQQVNQLRATNDQATQGQTKGDQQSAAGRGFGSNSPLLQLLAATRQMGNNATNAQSETATRLNAAQMNSDQLLKSQQAREAQFATRQSEDIARRTPYVQQQTTLLGALAGLV